MCVARISLPPCWIANTAGACAIINSCVLDIKHNANCANTMRHLVGKHFPVLEQLEGSLEPFCHSNPLHRDIDLTRMLRLISHHTFGEA